MNICIRYTVGYSIIALFCLMMSMPILPQSGGTDTSQKSMRQLTQTLQSIINKSAVNGTKVSAMVYSLDNNQVLFDHNSRQPLTPASTTKLFSTYTALHIMGGDYSIPTIVATDAQPPVNGVLNGNVYIVGKGDALLTISDIEQLADQIEQAGIKKIVGNIYGDGSYFDNITQRHIYSGDGEIVEPLPPITALGYYRNSMTVMVSGGNPPRVQTIPPSDAFVSTVHQTVLRKTNVGKNSGTQIQKRSKNSAKKTIRQQRIRKKTTLKKKSAFKPVKKRRHTMLIEHPDIWVNRFGDAPLPPRRIKHRGRGPAIGINSSVQKDGTQHFTVVGSLGSGGIISKHYAIAKPELAVAGSLANRLRSGGVEIEGTIGLKKMPENAKILGESRRAVTEMLNLVNKNSDNFLAEQTFKMIGGFKGGQENTGRVAAKTITDELAQLGIYTEGVCINDGSGLCRKNLVSAKTEVDLLTKAAQSSFAQQFHNSLSIAGVDGTLRRRMIGTSAHNNVRAKTGTLRNVSALAGYVTTRDGEKLCFSIIWNGGSVGSYKMAENMFAVALAEFSRTNIPSLGTNE
ncbi:MAG TPA: D-alanyl-D-alanine carboxypeptidase/D-alanyl-D-alanine-endopeptidase [Candidatus Kapabacteria bacterium]|nr:D-alanyl-D-alanine carboxypeptidase/D-alanyl-D-alanine-endopeptidase [Candidatus Kapabacteria bacterium]